MSEVIEIIMERMAAMASFEAKGPQWQDDGPTNRAGAEILALLRPKPHPMAPHHWIRESQQHHQYRHHHVQRYPRDFLLQCSNHPAVNQMPLELRFKLQEYPEIAPKNGARRHFHVHPGTEAELLFNFMGHRRQVPQQAPMRKSYPAFKSFTSPPKFDRLLLERPNTSRFSYDPQFGWGRRRHQF